VTAKARGLPQLAGCSVLIASSPGRRYRHWSWRQVTLFWNFWSISGSSTTNTTSGPPAHSISAA
jgi:hypothetical protein